MNGDLHLKLVLDVTYDTNGVPEEELRDNLDFMVRHAMGEGLVTGETEAQIGTWKHRIEKVPPS